MGATEDILDVLAGGAAADDDEVLALLALECMGGTREPTTAVTALIIDTVAGGAPNPDRPAVLGTDAWTAIREMAGRPAGCIIGGAAVSTFSPSSPRATLLVPSPLALYSPLKGQLAYADPELGMLTFESEHDAGSDYLSFVLIARDAKFVLTAREGASMLGAMRFGKVVPDGPDASVTLAVVSYTGEHAFSQELPPLMFCRTLSISAWSALTEKEREGMRRLGVALVPWPTQQGESSEYIGHVTTAINLFAAIKGFEVQDIAPEGIPKTRQTNYYTGEKPR